jgi:hypothetical protein
MVNLVVRRECKYFQCKNGHVSCEDCYKSLRTCSVCRVDLSHPGIRNLQVEQLIDGLPLQCVNFEEGCLYETAEGSESLRNHECECVFKPHPCPHTACDKKVPLHLLEAHVTSKHKAVRIIGSFDGLIDVEWPAQINVPLNHWKLKMVSLNGRILFPMLFKKDNIYYVWLQDSSTGLQREVEMSLYGERGSQVYRGNVMGIDTCTEYVTSHPEQILTFTHASAKQCLTKNGKGGDVLKLTFKMIGEEFSDVHAKTKPGVASAISSTTNKTKGKQSVP